MIPKFELTNCLIKVNTVFNVFSLPYLVCHPRINVEFLNFSCEAIFPQTAFLLGLFPIRVDTGPIAAILGLVFDYRVEPARK